MTNLHRLRDIGTYWSENANSEHILTLFWRPQWRWSSWNFGKK